MYRTASSLSKSQKKCSPSPATAKMERRKEQLSPRDPLKDLNGIVSSGTNNSNSSNTSSVEAPRGCLRFFLSQSSSSSRTPLNRPKTLSKTPKSAPNVRPKRPSKPRPPKENSSKCTVSEKPVSQKAEKTKKTPPCLYQWQSGKKSSSKTGQKTKISSALDATGSSVNKLASGSKEFEQQCPVGDAGEPTTELRAFVNSDVNFTPLSKLATGLGLDCAVGKVMEENSDTSNTTKTPPVQASVSPEIQCGSSVVSTTTPTCYGAGHAVSGVTDKRKCRPRGILTVGDNNDIGFGTAKAFDNFDDDGDEDVIGVVDSSSVSMVPLPAEASMHWLLSPCNEEDEDQKGDSENGSGQFRRFPRSAILHSPSSPSSGHGFSSDICHNTNMTNGSGTTNINRRRSSSLISPSGLREFEGLLGPLDEHLADSSPPHASPSCNDVSLKEERKHRYDVEGENSPFSMELLGSGNVIQTPQSNSSTDRGVGLSWLNTDDSKKCHFGSVLGSVTEVLQMASLSPKRHASVWDATTSSFQFDCPTTHSNSIDLTKFQRILDNRASWISTSTLENVSQSQMRISWREGLVSRIFEMDEFDCCRCLSDEEEDTNSCIDDRSKSHRSPELNVDSGNNQILTDGFGSTEFVDSETGIVGKGKERIPPQIPCSSAESISTDGGGLVASGDLDWTLCYKNYLFEV